MADFNYHSLGSDNTAAKSAVDFNRGVKASHQELSIMIHGCPVNCVSPSIKRKEWHARKQHKEEFLNCQ